MTICAILPNSAKRAKKIFCILIKKRAKYFVFNFFGCMFAVSKSKDYYLTNFASRTVLSL